MPSVRTFHLPHYDSYPVHVALFQDVQNAAFLKSQLLAANPEFDYAFLDASMILSPAHLLTTTFLTLHSFSSPTTSRPKTRSPHSELVFRLSPNNNIGQSYKLFGIGESTREVVVVKLGVRVVSSMDGDGEGSGEGERRLEVDENVNAESVARHLESVVQGRSVEVRSEEAEELGLFADLQGIRKVYKLGDMGVKKGGKKGGAGGGDRKERDERKELESVVLGIMSLKGS
ncbi:hypothetical protein NX059_010476 [Plenodomus lindquistii]|nr:hypothetical protein NX059_010476 [Plenodomus lindquistii]